MKNLLIQLRLIFLATSLLSAQQIREIDSIFKILSANDRFSGNILIAEKGKIIYEKSFGFSNRSTEEPLGPQNIFNVASVSKTFTAVATMQLVEEGLLHLDDDISTHLTELPYKNILIKHLLSHTSGLPKVQIQPFRKHISGKKFTNKELIATFSKIAPKLHFEPGADYNYANTNYILLALIIEKISGKGFDEFLRKQILEKCDMQQTFLFRRRVPKQNEKAVVSYYRKPKWLSDAFQLVDTLAANIEDETTFGKIYGASSIHTTARDILKFHNALQNGILLSKASLQKMYTPIKLGSKTTYGINKASNYPSVLGLGWKIAKDSTKGKMVYHFGGFQGGRSFLIRNVQKDQCVIILTNNVETERYTFTAPMRVLNQAQYKLDRISLPRIFSNEYLKNGIDSALLKYKNYENDTIYIPFIAWDFEEIGTELLDTKDYQAAVKVFELYSLKFPDEYSWAMLGDALLLSGDRSKALDCFEKSLGVNPKYEHSKLAVQKIKNENPN